MGLAKLLGGLWRKIGRWNYETRTVTLTSIPETLWPETLWLNRVILNPAATYLYRHAPASVGFVQVNRTPEDFLECEPGLYRSTFTGTERCEKCGLSWTCSQFESSK